MSIGLAFEVVLRPALPDALGLYALLYNDQSTRSRV